MELRESGEYEIFVKTRRQENQRMRFGRKGGKPLRPERAKRSTNATVISADRE
jgi:hypothetical protein